MDNNQISVATFNKLAEKYQDKYMDFDFYCDTFDEFCTLVGQPQAHILDIGCGPGNVSRYILNKRPDHHIFGIDLAPNMVELAKINNPSGHFVMMDSRHIADLEPTFDAILCCFCIPYLSKSDVESFIQTMRTKIATGGYLYLSTMEDNDSRSGLQTSSSGDQVYIYYHQISHLQHHLEANGFKLVKFQRKAFPVTSGEPTTDLFIYAQAI